jgi:hypothetical protein
VGREAKDVEEAEETKELEGGEWDGSKGERRKKIVGKVGDWNWLRSFVF